MTYPSLPAEFGENCLGEDVTQELWNKVILELLNADWTGRTHHNRRTYDAGCKGPLCAKAQREHSRRRSQTTTPSEKYRFMDAALDYFKPIAEQRIDEAREHMIMQLTG